MLNGFNSRRGRSRIFACGNRNGRCRWSAGFLGDPTSPSPLQSGSAAYYSPSTALKTSISLNSLTHPLLTYSSIFFFFPTKRKWLIIAFGFSSLSTNIQESVTTRGSPTRHASISVESFIPVIPWFGLASRRAAAFHTCFRIGDLTLARPRVNNRSIDRAYSGEPLSWSAVAGRGPRRAPVAHFVDSAAGPISTCSQVVEKTYHANKPNISLWMITNGEEVWRVKSEPVWAGLSAGPWRPRRSRRAEPSSENPQVPLELKGEHEVVSQPTSVVSLALRHEGEMTRAGGGYMRTQGANAMANHTIQSSTFVSYLRIERGGKVIKHWTRIREVTGSTPDPAILNIRFCRGSRHHSRGMLGLFLTTPAMAELLACSPRTKANRVQSPTGQLPDLHMLESCRTIPLVGGSSRGSPASPALSFRRCTVLTSITVIGSQDLAFNGRLNLFNRCNHLRTPAIAPLGREIDALVPCIHLALPTPQEDLLYWFGSTDHIYHPPPRLMCCNSSPIRRYLGLGGVMVASRLPYFCVSQT
ncbi:hypothetical protein PR048_025724 [Dryococelus australis]|uniref:Uncharacterized protein n=1 Tax=Dryococelus australis TaxID=614101 RepID=A0ABQ9GJD2_9NEOP|nr:hypothetical protein PR048_025724 [Dryococelus australis]